MKISEKFFRTVVANIFIIFALVSLATITTLGQTTSVFSSNKASAIYHGNKNNNNISLMFNVYQGEEYIDDILEELKVGNAQATFFVGGCWAVKNSDTLKKIIEAGHEVGNHGYWHKDHKQLNEEKNRSEMLMTHKIVSELCNYQIKLFAPPSGSYSSTTIKVAQDVGYKTIMWSKDTIDWRDQNVELIISRATKNPTGGDLILMHPTKCTALAVGDIISFYNQRGYKLTTVSQNIL